MTVRATAYAAAAFVLGLVLTGCSNERSDDNVLTVARAVLPTAPDGPAQAPTPEQVAQYVDLALASESGPMALMQFEQTGNTAVLHQIGANRPYRTWTTWGQSEGRTVSSRGGMVTATRGLGRDLMSSDVDAVLELVSARRPGRVWHQLRFLDGENQIYAIKADCAIARGAATHVQAGAIDRPAVVMTATCAAGRHVFENTYAVDAAGRVLRAEQWLGPHHGQALFQQLR